MGPVVSIYVQLCLVAILKKVIEHENGDVKPK